MKRWRVSPPAMPVPRVTRSRGGSVTGEHGIGVEKIGFMNKMFTPTDLAAMKNLRDAFNPQGNLSPDKMLPVAGGCGEMATGEEVDVLLLRLPPGPVADF